MICSEWECQNLSQFETSLKPANGDRALDTESGCDRLPQAEPWGYTDKARARGLKRKPIFTNRIWYEIVQEGNLFSPNPLRQSWERRSDID
ncbi:hypothetical protein [Laspinema olomoucense]|uniref:Uncharacterized protein n=1 Tax=Laspinema olomoucense D3b TaxID=2953688 RepID=A0ABT2NDG7_9CYAN|nr:MULTISPECIES: hypothetical protein [unclassified Laspinema]MCT7975357.1 hypothetical protein [Laspinema sp. D3d]MCT7980743.1 hypothetical protein [Laspinema sp. D3b]MCT7993882.1 hypothetical protein [Laspinema sp. D3c]